MQTFFFIFFYLQKIAPQITKKADSPPHPHPYGPSHTCKGSALPLGHLPRLPHSAAAPRGILYTPHTLGAVWGNPREPLGVLPTPVPLRHPRPQTASTPPSQGPYPFDPRALQPLRHWGTLGAFRGAWFLGAVSRLCNPSDSLGVPQIPCNDSERSRANLGSVRGRGHLGQIMQGRASGSRAAVATSGAVAPRVPPGGNPSGRGRGRGAD